MNCEHPGCHNQVHGGARLCPAHLQPVAVLPPPGPPPGPGSLQDQLTFLSKQVDFLNRGLHHAIGMDEFDLVQVRNTLQVLSAVTHIMAVLQRNDDAHLGGDQLWVDAARLVREQEAL